MGKLNRWFDRKAKAQVYDCRIDTTDLMVMITLCEMYFDIEALKQVGHLQEGILSDAAKLDDFPKFVSDLWGRLVKAEDQIDSEVHKEVLEREVLRRQVEAELEEVFSVPSEREVAEATMKDALDKG